MGMIMSVGVSISNAVLLITNAEELRRVNGNAIICPRGRLIKVKANCNDRFGHGCGYDTYGQRFRRGRRSVVATWPCRNWAG
jgi:hypothetical protein